MSDRNREYRLKRFYDLTIEDYENLFEFQGGTCWLCKRPPGKMRLSVDHDHRSGEVRALLCLPCNGRLSERVTAEWLQAAAEYLLDPPAGKALGRIPQGVVGRITKRRKRRRK